MLWFKHKTNFVPCLLWRAGQILGQNIFSFILYNHQMLSKDKILSQKFKIILMCLYDSVLASYIFVYFVLSLPYWEYTLWNYPKKKNLSTKRIETAEKMQKTRKFIVIAHGAKTSKTIHFHKTSNTKHCQNKHFTPNSNFFS